MEMEHHNTAEMIKGYTEIDAEQLTAIQQERSTLLIDVRERHEFPVLNEVIFKKVPMSEFAEFLAMDVAEENIVFICQHGIRSVAAAEALQEKYGQEKQIYSLKGGVVKWRNYFL